MSKTIVKKTYSEYFEMVKSGLKTFDLRVADFNVEPGDILELVEIDQQKKLTGRKLRKKVGAVMHTKITESWYRPDDVSKNGYVVMSLHAEKREKNRQIVDENDVVLGAKLDSTVDFTKDIYRTTALWLKNSKGEFLLAKRSPKKKNGGGQWGPSVAGTVENTETYLENIQKEVPEEIGVTGLEFTEGPKMYFHGARKYFAQFYFATCPDNTIFDLEDEVESVKWVSKEWLKKDIYDNPESYVDHTKEEVEECIK